MKQRSLLRLSQRLKLPSSVRYLPSFPRHKSTSNKPGHQAHPIGDYYASILTSSSPEISSTPPTTASPSNPPITSSSTPSHSSASGAEPGPSILFSSRLSSPLERRSEILRKSQRIAGVLVPPRPEEPDNCCMSGCVNCVWDRYRDEIEEWAAAKKEADRALKKERKKKSAAALAEAAASMDDDGAGSEGNWDVGGEEKGDDLFEGIPVGIRAFMVQEKKLKEKHMREKAAG
ncbi:hypothetical protein SS1G_04743 [Sclerotinia sclerotiorum 1980 UF-70]|uniref:Oxidoreductase-like domain-containing protein n=2 Tax=Sclerotinia sclerotiorum (strain ATCC 18683 / 1980 / Ss-1) TaxID=665079 RepID=A7EHF1_SCLS1|nr:hypothetical protein SS1G_04743 [Sclerotinia sclerotiorum 1980 UF-70]APA06673.1 hypothetical protein sscle_02g014430 [Sclerotinia sclerotiorum 1980 UF-70]EDO02267.1 hypothetical protein SS1G_04743 [Sclerotinia sclerotiorum 1980 UF-70]